MKLKRTIWIVFFAAALIALFFYCGSKKPADDVDGEAARGEPTRGTSSHAVRHKGIPVRAEASSSDGSAGAVENAAVDADEAKATSQTVSSEDEGSEKEERIVDDFDELTDKWTAPAKEGVGLKDVDSFVAQFRKVPANRKEECLHRALNLIPDENVMLLAGILMDKAQAKELVELVYNDVLNRSEDVKQPILQQIFKDRDHPCWATTAWILDVTGEAPPR